MVFSFFRPAPALTETHTKTHTGPVFGAKNTGQGVIPCPVSLCLFDGGLYGPRRLSLALFVGVGVHPQRHRLVTVAQHLGNGGNIAKLWRSLCGWISTPYRRPNFVQYRVGLCGCIGSAVPSWVNTN